MLNAIRSHIMRMINEDEKKREMAKKKQTREIKKKIHTKAHSKKTIGWKYNSKTGRYEPNLAKSKRHNF